MQDCRGARGANAGDDYHELWALRTAMALLDSGTNMHAMTVEGLTLEDESGVLASTWDGVDCACFYGGDSLESVERIEIIQVKYSAANPAQEWNVTRLTHATNKLKTNSVIGRMAQAFTGIYTKQAAEILKRYTDRLLERISPEERDPWELAQIPIDNADALARFLYAFFSDLDVRIRWRAAHALRSLARLGEIDVLNRIVALYDMTSEPVFRAKAAPFYWMAARLWLLITLDRIATETPTTIAQHGLWLCQVANDRSFPHVLLRAFAKSAATKLSDAGFVCLDPTQRAALEQVNAGIRNQKQSRRKPPAEGFDCYTQTDETRRFHFDSTDTLSYWYDNALRVFTNVSRTAFLDTAERWIVDRWGVTENPWRWEDQPRRSRLSNRNSMMTLHRHGELPTIERYDTHLEWHAMWCTVGELMADHALITVDEENDYSGLDNWLARNSLSIPPLWLADINGPKPLEDSLWFPPVPDIDRWRESISDDFFLNEVGVSGETHLLVVGSHHTTRSRDFNCTVRVNSALVSPKTAGALLRALQTVDEPWDYCIPDAGNRLEINKTPYKLVGWLSQHFDDSGIDDKDPFCYDIHRVDCQPSDDTLSALHLDFVCDPLPRWVTTQERQTIFTYQAWGDVRGDEDEDRLSYDSSIRSSGSRLHIDCDALRIFLNQKKVDLIVEVEVDITRRSDGYGHNTRLDTEEEQETRYDRLLLFRRDGTIESIDGCVGTWTAPCAGTGPD